VLAKIDKSEKENEMERRIYLETFATMATMFRK
jgi:hypothetical protein